MFVSDEKVQGLVLGLAVGDALGVPFEFLEPSNIENEKFEEMKGYGTHNQPAGSFSDDTSLCLCTIESLIHNYNQDETAHLFIRWRDEFYWTASNNVFDIGITTDIALSNIKNGISINDAAPKNERSCGNGALMRILPLVFYCDNLTLDEIYQLVERYASITHGHIRSHMACFYLLVYAHRVMRLPNGSKQNGSFNKRKCFADVSVEIERFFQTNEVFRNEIQHFERLFNTLPNQFNELQNTGYVIHSLEVVFSLFLRYNRYEIMVTQAIKLGGDTDTNACIVGGLAGLFYGKNNIPERWSSKLLKINEILELARRWEKSMI
jgi:ADP-ribosyl-[dinitrogen reductase] hydrolase